MEFKKVNSVEEAYGFEHAITGKEHYLQRKMTPGKYFIRAVLLGEESLVIFGEVLAIPQEMSDLFASPHMSNYRYCRCHSAACLDGELGTVHVGEMEAEISKEMFDEARSAQWEVGIIFAWAASGRDGMKMLVD